MTVADWSGLLGLVAFALAMVVRPICLALRDAARRRRAPALRCTWVGEGSPDGVPTRISVTIEGGNRPYPPHLRGITWRRP